METKNSEKILDICANILQVNNPEKQTRMGTKLLKSRNIKKQKLLADPKCRDIYKSWHQTAEVFRRIGRGKIGVKYTLLIFDKNLEEILDIKSAMNWGDIFRAS